MLPEYIVVIGASAGGITALSEALHQLPGNSPAAFLVTLHLSAEGKSIVPAILARASGLKSNQARDKQSIHASQILVAPPQFDMIVERDRVRLVGSPNGYPTHPAINPLFYSAAQIYGRKVIGIILSGMLDDGSLGLAAVKRSKGLCIVQDPGDAQFDEMPTNAILEVNPHLILTADEIRQFLTSLGGEKRRKIRLAPVRVRRVRRSPRTGTRTLLALKNRAAGK